MKKPQVISCAAVAGMIAFLAGCSATDTGDAASPAATTHALLASYDLEELSPHELVDALEAMPVADRPDDLIASVRPDSVLVSGLDREEPDAIPLADEFYLSVAPYVTTTHECFYHSLTTCQGELANAEVHVTVTGEDGTVWVDEDTTTHDNGFVSMWLPRDLDGTLQIEHDGLTFTGPVGTSDDDPTCVTTAQLA